MNLRSFAVCALLGAAACDPTGNLDVPHTAANVRLANFIANATPVNLFASGALVATNVAFGVRSSYHFVDTHDSIFVLQRASDNTEIGVDSVHLVAGRRYTWFGLGVTTNFASRLALDDTVLAAAGTMKLRFVHGIAAESIHGLDLYVSHTSDSLVDITPAITGLGYGLASSYVVGDTGTRRIRITVTGQVTTLLDTILPSAFASTSVVSVVATDKVSGGVPARLQVLVDKAP